MHYKKIPAQFSNVQSVAKLVVDGTNAPIPPTIRGKRECVDMTVPANGGMNTPTFFTSRWSQ